MNARRQVEVAHVRAGGRGTARVAASQAGGLEVTRLEPMWRPVRHPSERSIVTYWWAAITGS